MAPCSKKRYESLSAAGRALRGISANSTRREAGVYPCRRCHAFHLTSDVKSVKNKWTAMALHLVADRAKEGTIKR